MCPDLLRLEDIHPQKVGKEHHMELCRPVRLSFYSPSYDLRPDRLHGLIWFLPIGAHHPIGRPAQKTRILVDTTTETPSKLPLLPSAVRLLDHFIVRLLHRHKVEVT